MPQTRQWGNEVDRLGDELGLSASQASKLNAIAQSVGLTTDEVSTTFGMLAKKISDSAVAIVKGESDFDKWGVKLSDIRGEIVPFDEAMRRIKTRFQEIGQNAQGSALLMDIFGKTGKTLSDFLSLTDDEMKTMIKDAQDFGLVLDGPASEGLQKFNRDLLRFDLQLKGIKLAIGQQLIPILSAMLQWVRQNSGAFKAFAESLRTPLGIIKEVADRIGAFIAQMRSEGLVNAVVSLASDIVQKIGEVLGKVGAWVTENWPKWRQAFADLFDKVGILISENGPKWRQAFGEALDKLGTWISETWKTWRPAFGELFDNVVSWIRTIGWPSIVNFIETQVPAFANWIVESLPEWIKNLGNLISDFIQWFLGTGLPTIAEGFSTATAKIGGWLLDAIGWMSHVGMPAAFSTLVAIGGAVLNGIVQGLGDLKTKIWNWIKEAVPLAADIEAFIRGRMPGASAPTPPVLTPEGFGGGAGAGGGGGGGGGKSWVPDSPAATLDDIYANFTNKYGTMPDYQTALDLLGKGLTYRQVSQGIGLAEGGIVTRPTHALIGEAGPEAVIPLGRAGGIGGAQTVNVYVSGNVTRSEEELAGRISDVLIRKLFSQRAVSF